ncbi:MAG: hypothetical protein EPO67_18285 [Reyranella sp.]|nr:MAG: hypothetical protein EPO67_18285 [Reyranella sp.]
MGRHRRHLFVGVGRLRGPGLSRPALRPAPSGRGQGRQGGEGGGVKPPVPGPADKTLPTPDPAQVQYIRSYGPGRFAISEREWQEPVLVTPAATYPWPIVRADELSLESLVALRSAATPTELLVLGCGPRAVFIQPDVRAELKAAGIGLEVVDTGSACRIYNVLLAEGRRVAAALIPL